MKPHVEADALLLEMRGSKERPEKLRGRVQQKGHLQMCRLLFVP
jgi:hypothetical protein